MNSATPDELYILGEEHAERALESIATDTAHPDELLRAITNAFAEDGRLIALTPRIRGLLRRIQKSLEAAHG